MEDSAYAAGYRFGQLITLAAVLALVVWGIVAIRRNNAKQRAMQHRNPQADLALLSVAVLLHTGADKALALVSGIAGASGRLVPVTGPAPAWRIDGGHPVVTLEPGTGGSTLAVRELVIPLPSPAGAIMWAWLIGEVERASARDGVPMSRAEQRLVMSQPIDSFSAIWSSAR
jgi:hypothetical protein